MQEFVYSIIIGTSGLLATSIALGNIKERTQLMYIGLCVTLALWTGSLMFGYLCISWNLLIWSDQLIKLAYGSGFFLFVIMYLFLQSFKSPPNKSLSGYTYIFSIIGSIMAIIATVTPWVHQAQVIVDQTYSMDILGPGYATYTIFLIVFILLNTISAIQSKSLFPALTWGAVSFLSIIFLTNILIPILILAGYLPTLSQIDQFTDTIRIAIRYSPAYALFLVIPSFRAIFTKHLFHISLRWMGWLRKSIIILGYLCAGMIASHLLTHIPLSSQTQNIISFLIAYIAYQIIKTYIPVFISPQLQAFVTSLHQLKPQIIYASSLQIVQHELQEYFVNKLNCIKSQLYIDSDTKTLQITQHHETHLPIEIQGHALGILVITHNPNEPIWHADQCEALHLLDNALVIAVVNHLEHINQIPHQLMEIFENKLKHVGHEMRNPLTTAIMQAEYLKESNRLSPSISSAVEHVLQSLQQATILSHTLFDSEVEQRAQEINLDALINRIVKAYTPLCIKQKITLEYHYPKQTVLLQGVEHKMMQVFDNLLNNALEFTPPQGRIELTLTKHKHIIIEDSGPGISLSEQSNVFKEGYSTRKKQAHHHGLGLFISQKIVNHHQGIITIEQSEKLGGAKICIQF